MPTTILPANTFLIGCTHFGHANIIRLAGRPFENVTEMNETMLSRWNRAVGPDDTVVHLGDFFWNKTARDEIGPKLNGRKIFLQGNHDPDGFGVAYMEARWGGSRLVLFHYPIDEWNGWFRGAIHLHAHTHAPEIVSAPGRYNVGADALGFTPVAMSTIAEMHSEHHQRAGEDHG